MSYRARSFTSAPSPARPAQVRTPSALRIMTALVVVFVVISLLVLLAGRVPFTPSPITQPGATAAEYLVRDTALLSTYGNTLEGSVHIPIDQAMGLIVERGLPVYEGSAATATPTP